MLRFTLIRKLKKVKMTEAEKAAGLAAIMDVQKEFPINSLNVNHMNILSTNSLMRLAGAGIAAVVLTTGGTALAAEKSLPGDLLYPVKVKVNENVRGSLAFNAEAKANWEAKLLERRMNEAERLEKLGRFDAKAKARIKAQIDTQTKKTQDRIAELKAAGQTEAAANLQVRLDHFTEVKTQQLKRLELFVERKENQIKEKAERAEERAQMKNSTSTPSTTSTSTTSTIHTRTDAEVKAEKKDKKQKLEIKLNGETKVKLNELL